MPVVVMKIHMKNIHVINRLTGNFPMVEVDVVSLKSLKILLCETRRC